MKEKKNEMEQMEEEIKVLYDENYEMKSILGMPEEGHEFAGYQERSFEIQRQNQSARNSVSYQRNKTSFISNARTPIRGGSSSSFAFGHKSEVG